MINAEIPVLGFAAYSGTGKTSLLKKLLPLLRERGLRIGMVKHTHHNFDIDQPGKDSYELRKAGASQMLVASGRRWALMVETDGTGDPQLQEMIGQLDQASLDLILVEGFKHVAFPKIELHRSALGKPLLYPNDPAIVAFACDGPPPDGLPLPLLDLNETRQIADFIIAWMRGL
ncbi:molybdopterin-guanine dinucleotide biosynthesis protein MobB [Sedimenticola hydrogenitrophicus]|uniref:molybdopterin-guanine dinucleotide biosynthesis protein MobB n=1 Tax=Sedimenticola hydrogenitrophicus TaxID=2967975 RepID=UPI0023B1A817|nr:molybdopterin-guanine dinucleotide biosynthesis protein MobB [Sedimenticola hydrogenitrophicus]